MRAYKWMTEDMKAFHDGYQFHFGWNKQNGEKNGLVCVSGGFHITANRHEIIWANNAKHNPKDSRIVCHEVYYRKRNVLGKSGDKIRVSEFKILKKKQTVVNGKHLGIKPGYYFKYSPTTATSTYRRPYNDSTSTDSSPFGSGLGAWTSATAW